MLKMYVNNHQNSTTKIKHIGFVSRRVGPVIPVTSSKFAHTAWKHFSIFSERLNLIGDKVVYRFENVPINFIVVNCSWLNFCYFMQVNIIWGDKEIWQLIWCSFQTCWICCTVQASDSVCVQFLLVVLHICMVLTVTYSVITCREILN